MALKQCNKCGANISLKAQKCPKCGFLEPFNKDKIICVECGTYLPSNHKGSCPECGNPDFIIKSNGKDEIIFNKQKEVTKSESNIYPVYSIITTYDSVLNLVEIIFCISALVVSGFISYHAKTLVLGIIIFCAVSIPFGLILWLIECIWVLFVVSKIKALSNENKNELKEMLHSYSWKKYHRSEKIMNKLY